ncbi:ATPase [Bacillus phage vB_BboS-125]|uniref:Chromosome segregation protein n=1 Tax=Bacillus phage vB_BboS-125 TaxID=2419618 RepID=A0A3G3BVV8_9CAUD|nr:ATPase [Bacillus phage vB_BboS-125]AYP68405.1 chromosome segregation protein [Bacillus phage vB_BboS-125]
MYRLQKAKLDLRNQQQKLAAREGQKELLERQKQKAQDRRTAAEEQLGIYDLVQILLQKTSDYARQQAKQRIEEIVTSALSVVFAKEYRFEVKLDVRASQPIAEYWLYSDDVATQLKPPDYDRGGGIADVVSLALRLAVGELSNVKGPLFLDEVGKHVSEEYAPNVAYFLKEYSQNFNRQIVLITHNKHLADIGEVSLAVSQKNGESQVTII